jgi:hypothetical protein
MNHLPSMSGRRDRLSNGRITMDIPRSSVALLDRIGVIRRRVARRRGRKWWYV